MYPPAARLDLVERLHGHDVPDPYRWLEDPGSDQTRDWSTAQDALVESDREKWPLRPFFRDQITALLGGGAVGAPVWRRSRPFETRRRAGAELAVLLTTDPDGTERDLVDPIAIDSSGTTTLDMWAPSMEGERLAYQLSSGGTEFSRLYVLDVLDGSILDGPIDRVRYSSVAWLPGGEAFYYVRHLSDDEGLEDAHLYRRVYLHRVGTPTEADVLIFGADRPRGTYLSVAVSADGRHLTLTASLGTDPRNDAWLADLTSSDLTAPQWRELQVGVDARVSPYVRAGVVYLWTDRDAPRGRICACLPDELEYSRWRELVAEDPVAVLSDYEILDGAEISRPLLVVVRSRHAVSELSRHDLATGARLGSIDLPGLGTVTALVSRPVGGREVWFSYTDFTTPATVYRWDGRSGELDVFRSVPGMPPITAVTTRQASCESDDGTVVRLFVIAPTEADEPAGGPGPRPTVLYGYGGFNVALTPAFTSAAVAWVRAGGVYAVANLRGGSEEGEEWHRAGMLAGKQRVFDDFQACASWLVETGLTTPAHLGLMGGSNGGLLVGAALTQNPATAAAVVCSAPLLDMVRYERFGLGSTWAGEYGHAADPDEFATLFEYSPYHHVHPETAYPAVLFTVFDGDSRVDPLHARKLAAALQHATTGPGPILLRRESDVGHGSRSTTRTVDLVADELAFLAAYTGLSIAKNEA
jgi:prolyl oligopeptidase